MRIAPAFMRVKSDTQPFNQPASAGFYVHTQTYPKTDRMVYDLYGLTEEEIKMVEESVGQGV